MQLSVEFLELTREVVKILGYNTVLSDGAVFGWGFSDRAFDDGEMDISEPESPGTPEQTQRKDGVRDISANMKKRKDFEAKITILRKEVKFCCTCTLSLKWELFKKGLFHASSI